MVTTVQRCSSSGIINHEKFKMFVSFDVRRMHPTVEPHLIEFDCLIEVFQNLACDMAKIELECSGTIQ